MVKKKTEEGNQVVADEEFDLVLHARKIVQQRNMEICMMLGRVQDRLGQFRSSAMKNLSFEFSNRVFQVLNLTNELMNQVYHLNDSTQAWLMELESEVMIPGLGELPEEVEETEEEENE
jgi:hypothetical protein